MEQLSIRFTQTASAAQPIENGSGTQTDRIGSTAHH